MTGAWQIFIKYTLFIYRCLKEQCAKSTELIQSNAKPSDNDMTIILVVRSQQKSVPINICYLASVGLKK